MVVSTCCTGASTFASPAPSHSLPAGSLAGLYWSPAGIAQRDPARRLVLVTRWTLARSPAV
ncbi:hypothetical protein PCANC_12091 [Puccinia coronata f. sp. avenae]|uniref:Uncharacterized protein n=1 Tax=Puccinia coronata f. sp. avenae TaxID=200324 RepID=A0A2N5UWV9_9BASI|nr:hypothetical protein PCANC_12091 [Puccinia coronata f. sp. avenae]